MEARDKTFTVKVDGETTGECFYGSFTVKTVLTHRDQLRKDQVRRELLGGVPGGQLPSPRAENTAGVISELAVRILKSPPWWQGDGLDLADDNVVQKVYDLTMAAEREVLEARIKAADAAREELRKAETPPPEAA